MSNTDPGRRMVFSRPKKVIRLHWFNAVAWLLLTVSGLGIIRGDVALMPEGYANAVQGLVGGQFNLITGHSLLGLLWVGVFILFTLFNWKEVVFPFLKKILSVTPRAVLADATQMVVDIGGLFGLFKSVRLPPAGRYNGAQRLLGTLILLSSVVIALSGTVMFALFLFTPVFVDAALFQWSLVAHGLFVGLVYIGLVAHIYYSVVEEPEVLESMKSGYLEEDYIRNHSPGWYEELRQQGKL
jgi:formate dehydrogenase subunit gamma